MSNESFESQITEHLKSLAIFVHKLDERVNGIEKDILLKNRANIVNISNLEASLNGCEQVREEFRQELKLENRRLNFLITHLKENCCCSSSITCVHCDALATIQEMR